MALTNNSYNERGAYAPPTSVFIDICCEGPVMQIGSWTPGIELSTWDDVDEYFDVEGPDFELEDNLY